MPLLNSTIMRLNEITSQIENKSALTSENEFLIKQIFREINETYSYQIGDSTLKELALFVNSHIRTTDILGRWEAEEFILILPETSKEQAQITAEHLKESIYNYDFKDLTTYITCSFGVVDYEQNEDIDSVIRRSSKALFHAKSSGKNCVKVG